MCGICGAVGAMIGRAFPSIVGIPFSIWQLSIGAGIGGGIGGWLFSEVSMHFLRPFYADYISKDLRRDDP